MVLALLQKQLHAAASPLEPQRVADVQEEQRCEDACVWEVAQRHSRGPELHSLHDRTAQSTKASCLLLGIGMDGCPPALYTNPYEL